MYVESKQVSGFICSQVVLTKSSLCSRTQNRRTTETRISLEMLISAFQHECRLLWRSIYFFENTYLNLLKFSKERNQSRSKLSSQVNFRYIPISQFWWRVTLSKIQNICRLYRKVPSINSLYPGVRYKLCLLCRYKFLNIQTCFIIVWRNILLFMPKILYIT